MKTKRFFPIVFGCICLLAGVLPVLAENNFLPLDLRWDFDVIIDDTGTASVSTGIEAFNNALMVAYYDQDDQRLKQAVFRGQPGSGNCGEELKWSCSPLTTNSLTGKYNDVASYRDETTNFQRTGFLYYDEGQNSLELIERHASQYFSYQTQTTLFNINSLCQIIGCAVNSAVALVYDSQGYAHATAVIDTMGDNRLFYFHQLGSDTGNCADFGGDASWQCEQIEAGFAIAVAPRIVIRSPASPYIAYLSPAESSLKLAYPDTMHPNCGPKDNWRCIMIDSVTSSSISSIPSMAYGDTFHIAYYTPVDGYLRLARYVGVGGNCGFDWNGLAFSNVWQCDHIDSIGIDLARVGISLVMDGSQPVIAYMDANDGDRSLLKLAQRVERAGLTFGNCGPIYLHPTWDCRVLAQSEYNLGSEVDMFISPRGGLFLVYLEDNDPAQQNHLYAVRQNYLIGLPLILK